MVDGENAIQDEIAVAKELYELVKIDTEILMNEDTKTKYIIDKGKNYLAQETFEEMRLPESLISALYRKDHKKPSFIQKNVIPTVINQSDIAVQSKSGTGKTIAYLAGVLTRLYREPTSRAVIVSPTRELTKQIHGVIIELTADDPLPTLLGIKNASFENISNYRIIIASPGTLLAIFNKNRSLTSSFNILVLDEADLLLDKSNMGAQSFRILKLLGNSQKVYVSATYNEDLKSIISAYSPSCTCLYEAENRKPEDIKMYYIDVTPKNKFETLKSLFEFLVVGQMVIFVSKKYILKELEENLKKEKHDVSILHGEISESERDEAYRNFKEGKTNILICTDVFSRGIDIPQVNLIINYNLPYRENTISIETYIHRVGRSGRFGRSGFVIDMISNNREYSDYVTIQRSLNTISKKFSIDGLYNVVANEE